MGANLTRIGLTQAALNLIAAGSGAKEEISQYTAGIDTVYLWKYDVQVVHPISKVSVHTYAYEYLDKNVQVGGVAYMFMALGIKFTDITKIITAFEWYHNPSANWYSVANGTLWPWAAPTLGVEYKDPGPSELKLSLVNVGLTNTDQLFADPEEQLTSKWFITLASQNITLRRFAVGNVIYNEYPQWVLRYNATYYVFMMLVQENNTKRAGWTQNNSLNTLYVRNNTGEVNPFFTNTTLVYRPDFATGFIIPDLLQNLPLPTTNSSSIFGFGTITLPTF